MISTISNQNIIKKQSISKEFEELAEVFQNQADQCVMLRENITRQIQSLTAKIDQNMILRLRQKEIEISERSANPESAMEWEKIAQTIYIYDNLQAHYHSEFLKLGGTEKIIAGFASRLAEKCNIQDCLVNSNARAYVHSDSQELKVTKNALRAILDPAPNSEHGSCLHPEAGMIYAAGRNLYARDLLAYYILAASDLSMPLDEKDEPRRKQCIEEELLHVEIALSDIRREHNGQIIVTNHSVTGRAVDDPIDEPSCIPGVVSRIGNMHLHNQLTSTDHIASPAKHFVHYMWAYIYEAFSKRHPETQCNLLVEIHQSLVTDDRSSMPQIDELLTHLLKPVSLRMFIDNLEDVFGSLDYDHKRLAMLVYFENVIALKYSISHQVLDKFILITNDSFKVLFKHEVEEHLLSAPEILEPIDVLNSIPFAMATLKEEILDIQIKLKKNPTDGGLVAVFSSLQDQFHALNRTRSDAETYIQKIAQDKFIEMIEALEQRYKSACGREILVISRDDLASHTFNPFWYAKTKLRIQDFEIDLKNRIADINRLISQHDQTYTQNLKHLSALTLSESAVGASEQLGAGAHSSTITGYTEPLEEFSRQQKRAAEHYMMSQQPIADCPELQKYLSPKMLVRIGAPMREQVSVSVFDPLDIENHQKVLVPRYLLEEYIQKDKRIRKHLSHHSDIFLRDFSEFKRYPQSNCTAYQKCFINQLLEHKKTNVQLYNSVLSCQSSDGLKELKQYIEEHDRSEFNELASDILSRLDGHVKKLSIEQVIQKEYVSCKV